ncbi:uncharacterized protein PpBr36_05713 [Pyricularia pennisetigena]|uniref:uncharacterized protein n=1 Tax=Pyricularia pennisetigena TaxID=1578925 RepID=UPI0011501AD4|nr:uncharacterized protein PpBr36_05713 [Pyricularia pennisetigena]TLS23523.1 hypothetical protein PpBr36_05713 [Pyricularia pennisetigena]
MVKPLTFKGDKKPKKRKRPAAEDDNDDAPGSKQAAADAVDEEAVANDDSWVSAEAVNDVSGPVMFVLPTEPPSALACDAAGKVFTLPIENIVDGNPASAEPHDVRQVFVANKIVGTENFRFKGHHGKYLGCDKMGILSATSDAVSPLECFVLIATPDTPGTFQVQTLRETFIAVKEPKARTAASASSSKSAKAAAPEVRGDASDITFETTLRIRMQARFKPRIKVSKEEKARERISRRELEEAVGRRLEDDEVRLLKRARREGDYHEKLLNLKIKSKHDKYG